MRKTNFKIVSLMICVLMLMTVIAGCGSSNNSAAPADANANNNANSKTDADTQTKAPEKTTLTFLIDNQSSLDGIKAVAEEIEKRFNIATEFELRPGGTEGDNVVKTRLAVGDMADLMYYNSGSLFKALNPGEYFVDLTNEPFMENVYDSFKTTVSDNGKVYGIPAASSVGGGWLYNKKVYQELGLTVPKTWDELMVNNEKIKAAGKTAVIGSFKDSWTSQLILLADYYNVQAQVPNFADDYTNNKAKFATTPAALRGFEKLQEIHDKGYMNKDNMAATYEDALKMLAEGSGVHYPMLTFALTNMNANYPDLVNDIGIFAQPGDSAEVNGLTVWMPAGIYLNKDGKNVEAAKKWAEFFISPEGLQIFMSKAKAEGPYVVKGVDLPDDAYPAVKEMLPYFEADKTAPALEFLSPVKGPALEQITVEVGGGIVTAKEGAQKYDKDVEKQAKQLGIKGW